MYYDDLVDSAFNDESSVDFKLRQKDATYALKKLDKNYEKYTFPFKSTWTDGKYYKNITVENYGSNISGIIRNAVTGTKYNIKVGSKDEALLFKVTNATGFNKRKEPLILYYDSPEQYEKHYFIHVSDEIKQKWLESSLCMQKQLNM
jgi:hypothetical protein